MDYQKTKRKNKIIILIGLLIIAIGSFVLIYNYYSNKKLDKIEDNSIDEFFNEPINDNDEIVEIEESNQDEKEKIIINYIAILEIPKINFRKGIVDKDDSNNNVNRNIYTLKETTLPDEQSNSHIILAAHSGNSYISYFKNLNKLDLNDEVYFYYKNIKYIYKINDRYEIEKNGTMELKITNESDITLVTCISGTKKQVIYVAKLTDKNSY